MVVRGAKYKRIELDEYPTPPYVVRAAAQRIPIGHVVVDPCGGRRGNVKRVLSKSGHRVISLDIGRGFDFLAGVARALDDEFDIFTNPPYGPGGRTALKFIERALEVTRPWRGRVVMLLPADFDSGVTRRHVFDHCPAFARKVVLLRRIKWFDGQSGSTNHAWYCWDHTHEGPPTLDWMEGIDDSERRRARPAEKTSARIPRTARERRGGRGGGDGVAAGQRRPEED